jgi:ferrochelatase
VSRTAIVLFNLGGPDSLDAVKPFLFNLFSDPAILRVPGLVRGLLARLIAGRRAPVAREIYAKMGGRSPILPETEAQAAALRDLLVGDGELEVAIAMRYWRPFAADAANQVAAFRPDHIVLLPLYPQYSTTTTASSIADWQRAAKAAGLERVPLHIVCCYPTETGFIRAQADAVAAALAQVPADMPVRVLFSAHGLPKRVVDDGDPYPHLVQRTAAAIAERLGRPGLDWLVSYQSRVGPLEWIGPATDAEVDRAGRDKVALIVTPIAFVSEHSETLVELDIEYRHRAEAAGVPRYLRVPTAGVAPGFIAGLAGLVREALGRPGIAPHGGRRLCPAACSRCPIAA